MLKRLYAKLRERIELIVLRPRQSTSLAIRRIFATRHGIHVGLYSYGCFDQWRMPGPITVGRWCSIANSVRSASINHPLSAMTTHPALFERAFGVVPADIVREVPLVIEDDVWIGHAAVILPGCKFIGRGAVIGAGSIVTRDVPAYTIVAGNPARVIRPRFSAELIAALEESRWWTMDAAEMKALVETDRDLVFAPTTEGVRAWIARRSA